jgi:hypothetical protein
MAMISTARTKIKAEAGYPCLIPRKTLKGAETHPLFRIHPFISVKHEITIAMNIIEEFGNLSGFKLNKNKTEGIWLGRLKHTKDKYENITWTNKTWRIEQVESSVSLLLVYDSSQQKFLDMLVQ